MHYYYYYGCACSLDPSISLSLQAQHNLSIMAAHSTCPLGKSNYKSLPWLTLSIGEHEYIKSIRILLILCLHDNVNLHNVMQIQNCTLSPSHYYVIVYTGIIHNDNFYAATFFTKINE